MFNRHLSKTKNHTYQQTSEKLSKGILSAEYSPAQLKQKIRILASNDLRALEEVLRREVQISRSNHNMIISEIASRLQDESNQKDPLETKEENSHFPAIAFVHDEILP